MKCKLDPTWNKDKYFNDCLCSQEISTRSNYVITSMMEFLLQPWRAESSMMISSQVGCEMYDDRSMMISSLWNLLFIGQLGFMSPGLPSSWVKNCSLQGSSSRSLPSLKDLVLLSTNFVQRCSLSFSWTSIPLHLT